MLLELIAAAMGAAANQAAVSVKDQPLLQRQSQCVANRVLNNAILQHRCLNQPRLGDI
jgi:hypothetical protein